MLRRFTVPFLAAVIAASSLVGPLGSPATARPSCGGVPATRIGDGGNNLMKGTVGRDVFVGGGGDDTILGYEGNDLMCGGPGDDMLVGGLDDDKGFGGTGGDGFLAFSGRDLSSGGPGVDATLHWFARRGVRVDLGKKVVLGEGKDRLESIELAGGSDRADVLLGGGKGDIILGEGGDDVIKGRGGKDYLVGLQGSDRIDGGPALDVATYFDAKSGVTVDLAAGTGGGSAGIDKLRKIEGIEGSDHGDTLKGNNRDNKIYGGHDKATDVIDARGGDDYVGDSSKSGRVDGGAGKDVLFSPFMQAFGDAGKDKIQSARANGGPDNDFIFGSGYGKDGDDVFVNGRKYFGGTGDDVMHATTRSHVFGYDEVGADPLQMGDDVISYVGAKLAIDLDLAAGTAVHRDDPKGAEDKYLVTTFKIIGTRFGDTLSGTTGDDTLLGWKGADALTGLESNDLLNGGAQDDVADGGLGIDSCPKVENRTFCEDELGEVPVPPAALPGGLNELLTRFRGSLHRGRAPLRSSEASRARGATSLSIPSIGAADMRAP